MPCKGKSRAERMLKVHRKKKYKGMLYKQMNKRK